MPVSPNACFSFSRKNSSRRRPTARASMATTASWSSGRRLRTSTWSRAGFSLSIRSSSCGQGRPWRLRDQLAAVHAQHLAGDVAAPGRSTGTARRPATSSGWPRRPSTVSSSARSRHSGAAWLRHRRVDPAGRHDVHARAVPAQLAGRRPGEADHPGLARGVVRLPHLAALAVDRGDEHDAAAARRAQDRRRAPQQVERGVEVDAEHRLASPRRSASRGRRRG